MSPIADPPPYFRLHVFVCTNRRPVDHPMGSCAHQGAEALRDHLKAAAKARGLGDVRVNAAGCLGRCEAAPVLVVYPEGVWYEVRTTADLDEIIDTHLDRGGRVARLMLDRPADVGAE